MIGQFERAYHCPWFRPVVVRTSDCNAGLIVALSYDPEDLRHVWAWMLHYGEGILGDQEDLAHLVADPVSCDRAQ